jgi:hypothetical protein
MLSPVVVQYENCRIARKCVFPFVTVYHCAIGIDNLDPDMCVLSSKRNRSTWEQMFVTNAITSTLVVSINTQSSLDYVDVVSTCCFVI